MWVSLRKRAVRDCYLGLWELQGFDALSIADATEDTLQLCNLGDSMHVAFVMSGAVAGVKVKC